MLMGSVMETAATHGAVMEDFSVLIIVKFKQLREAESFVLSTQLEKLPRQPTSLDWS